MLNDELDIVSASIVLRARMPLYDKRAKASFLKVKSSREYCSRVQPLVRVRPGSRVSNVQEGRKSRPWHGCTKIAADSHLAVENAGNEDSEVGQDCMQKHRTLLTTGARHASGRRHGCLVSDQSDHGTRSRRVVIDCVHDPRADRLPGGKARSDEACKP